jgi:uncharacterized protein YutE (UPF0331/DUF86 family)
MGGSARPPVAARARRAAFEGALAQAARTMAQLEAAVAAFPPDFDSSAFAAAWGSRDADERNRAMLVRSNMDDLHNLCQTLIALSVRVAQDAGAIPADRKTPAADQLRSLHLYPKEIEHLMVEVADLRNSSQHEYWLLEPGAVHAAVERERRALPAFLAALGAWIESLSW